MLRLVGLFLLDVALFQRAVMALFLPRPCVYQQYRSWLWAAVLAFAAPPFGVAQFREGFESPLPSWGFREADCGVRQLAHERTFQESHSGNGSEYLRLGVGKGSYIRVAHPIGKAALIAELAPSLWVKSDKPNIQ